MMIKVSVISYFSKTRAESLS